MQEKNALRPKIFEEKAKGVMYIIPLEIVRRADGYANTSPHFGHRVTGATSSGPAWSYSKNAHRSGPRQPHAQRKGYQLVFRPLRQYQRQLIHRVSVAKASHLPKPQINHHA